MTKKPSPEATALRAKAISYAGTVHRDAVADVPDTDLFEAAVAYAASVEQQVDVSWWGFTCEILNEETAYKISRALECSGGEAIGDLDGPDFPCRYMFRWYPGLSSEQSRLRAHAKIASFLPEGAKIRWLGDKTVRIVKE